MSKKSKNKNQVKKVLGSFAELGNTGKSALSRLATTVKADAPTMILGKKDFGGTVKTDSIKLLGGNKFSNFAKRLIPFHAVSPARANAQNNPAAARLKHIAGKMGKAAVPKTRKSKGIIWLFLFFAAVAGSGYYAWNSIDGLGDKVVQMVDYKSWLNKTAGKVSTAGQKPKSESINIGSRASKASLVTAQPVKKTITKTSVVKSKKLTVKKAHKSQTAKKTKAVAASKQKKWQANLAKLKKKSNADYQKASMKYRTNHK